MPRLLRQSWEGPAPRRMGWAYALVALALAGAEPAPLTVDLRAEAEVRAAQVRLGDIARLEHGEEATRTRLRGLRLGPVPPGGEPGTVSRTQVQRWVRSRLGMQADRIHWSGAQVCTVRRQVQAFDGAIVARKAQEHLVKAFEAGGCTVEVRLVRAPLDLKLPMGRVDCAVRIPAGLEADRLDELLATAPASHPLFSRRQSVWVDLSVDGEFVRAVAVPFEIQVYAPAYVGDEDLPVGQTLAPGRLKVRSVAWTGRDPLPVPVKAPAPFADLRLCRALKAGEPLVRNQVQAVPLVTVGGQATLRMHQGAILLESRVEVLQDGSLGQTVRVRQPQANQPILAQVTGPGAVEVRP